MLSLAVKIENEELSRSLAHFTVAVSVSETAVRFRFVQVTRSTNQNCVLKYRMSSLARHRGTTWPFCSTWTTRCRLDTSRPPTSRRCMWNCGRYTSTIGRSICPPRRCCLSLLLHSPPFSARGRTRRSSPWLARMFPFSWPTDRRRIHKWMWTSTRTG